MDNTTGKAPAKPTKARARKKPATKAVATRAAAPPAKELDWPKNLNSEKADRLFAELEAGTPRSKAPEKVGLAWRSIARYIKDHKDFRERVEEAELMGEQAIIDRLPGIADMAKDSDSARAATAQCNILTRYLELKAPHRHRMKHIALGGGAGQPPGDKPRPNTTVLGVILLPPKESGRGNGPTEGVEFDSEKVIQGSAVRILPGAEAPAE